jgi:uncharacterized protein YndB with AHSA1/START domain
MDPMTLAELDSAPVRLEFSELLPGPPEVVFRELAEPERWIGWFPLMREARWTSSQTACVGAERTVHLRVFGRFREIFLAWEPGSRMAFTMLESTSPLARRMAEDWRLAREQGGTRLTWVVGIAPTRIGKLAVPGLRPIVGRMFRQGMANLGRVLGGRGTQVA